MINTSNLAPNTESSDCKVSRLASYKLARLENISIWKRTNSLTDSEANQLPRSDDI